MTPREFLRYLLPEHIQFKEERGHVKVTNIETNRARRFAVSKEFAQCDEWYIGQLSKHIINTMDRRRAS